MDGKTLYATNGGIADIVDHALGVRWKAAARRVDQFLNGLGVSENMLTQTMILYPISTTNVDHTTSNLAALTADDGLWACMTTKPNDKGTSHVFAFPVRKFSSQNTDVAPFVDVHSRLVAWWLVNAWRCRQLANATWSLGDAVQTIPAAACARALLETAAAFWCDARNLQKLWQETKTEADRTGVEPNHWRRLSLWIFETTFAGKFDDRVPELAKLWGRNPRTNVLTQVEKLGKATTSPVSLQEDYQWLCNAVHPSVGGTLAFASPVQKHVTKAFSFAWYAPFPMHFQQGEVRESERTIQAAIARTAVMAIEVLLTTFDETLRIIDDVALTTRAPKFATFKYWRMVVSVDRNKPCPCRSGRKAKLCLHRWCDPAPSVSEQFAPLCTAQSQVLH